MRRLVYRPAARNDLGEISRYLTRTSGSPAIAKEFVASLRSQCKKLAGLSGTLGRPRTDLQPDMRSYACKGYIILFRYVPGKLQIVNVIEGHRDIEARFEE